MNKRVFSPYARGYQPHREPLDFRVIAKRALDRHYEILLRYAPGGQFVFAEYLMPNPHRVDRHLGSFKVNTRTGEWADFAVRGARGRDIVSLVAYLRGISNVEAARELAELLGIGGPQHGR